MKIICLGNEFIKEDCFAKEVGVMLAGKFNVVNIKDSFELMGIVSSGEDFIILDIVQGLNEVRSLNVEDLCGDSIVSAHDFDAGFVLKLLPQLDSEHQTGQGGIRIIGIPVSGDVGEICGKVLGLIGEIKEGSNFIHELHE